MSTSPPQYTSSSDANPQPTASPATPSASPQRPQHARRTSRTEKALRELLAKDAERAAASQHRRVATPSPGPRRASDSPFRLWGSPAREVSNADIDVQTPSYQQPTPSQRAIPHHLNTHVAVIGGTSNGSPAGSPVLAPVPLSAAPSHPTASPQLVARAIGHKPRHSTTNIPAPSRYYPDSRPTTPSPLARNPRSDERLPRRHASPVSPTRHRTAPNVQTLGARTDNTPSSPTPFAPREASRDSSQAPWIAQALESSSSSINSSPMASFDRSRAQRQTEPSPRRLDLHHPQARRSPTFAEWNSGDLADDASSPSTTPQSASSAAQSFLDPALGQPRGPHLERTFTPPCTQPSFNLKAASEICRGMQGYVSFFEVEGLGRPIADLEEEQAELERLERERKANRSWLTWFSDAIIKNPNSPHPQAAATTEANRA